MKRFIKFFSVTMILLPIISYANILQTEESDEDREDHKFKISDFQGHYISYSFTVGGVGRSGGVPVTAVGFSTSSISQFFIKKDGKGITNFTSLSTYTGPVGTSLIVTSTNQGNAPKFKFTVKLTDHKHGAGTFKVHDFPIPGGELTQDFVARKEGNKVVEFFRNTTKVSGILTASTSLAISVRQR